MKAGMRVKNCKTGQEGTVKGIWFNNPKKHGEVIRNSADSFLITWDDGTAENTSVKVWEVEILDET